MHNQIVEHLVNVLQQENLRGLLNRDHGNLSLRTDRDDDDLKEELQLRQLHNTAHLDQGIRRAHNGHDNLVQLHLWNTMKMSCTVCTCVAQQRACQLLVVELQPWNLDGLLNSQSHGDQTLRRDGDVDDLDDELHLRHLHCDAQLDQGICRWWWWWYVCVCVGGVRR